MMKFNSQVRYCSSIVKTFSVYLFLITFLFVVQPQNSIGSPPIAAGYWHTVALQSNGEVWAWGCNPKGQLGNGTLIDSMMQVQVIDPTAFSGFIGNVSAVAAGESHTVALKNDGSVWAWGNNAKGQLGNQTIIDSPIPVSVTYGWVTSAGNQASAGAPILNVFAIEAGYSHTVVLKTDGTVWCCGDNSSGQLGNGWIPDRSIMIQAKNLTGVAAIAAGDYHTVALKTDGTVWTWGQNTFGQLGNGTTTNSRIPVQVRDSNDPSGFLHDVSAIAAGGKHTIALKTDGSVWAWGDNSLGQIGDGTSSTSKHLRPAKVTASSYGFSAIAAGESHTVALDIDGDVWAWGNNLSGQLGNGTTISNNMPLQITGVSDISAIAAGYRHTVVMQNDGTVWAWGDNSCGQLGDATTQNSLTPVQSYWIQLLPLPNVVTGIAAAITTNSATLKGTVNPNGSPATSYFEYGPTLNYGQFTTSQSVGSGNSIVNVTAHITGLTPATLYNFRLVAWNSTGTEPALPGSNMTFTTNSAVSNPSLTIVVDEGPWVTGGAVTVDLTLLNAPPTKVSSISTDIDFDPNVLELENPLAEIGAAGSSAGKSIYSSLVDSNTFRVGVFSNSSTAIGALPTPIEDGIIAKVTFKIKSTVPDGTVTRLTHTAGGSDTTAAGNPVDVDVDALPIFPGAAITISRDCFLGDSNDDGVVIISEVQAAINMFLGISPVQPYCDWNGDGILSIFEIQIIINKYWDVAGTPPRPNC